MSFIGGPTKRTKAGVALSRRFHFQRKPTCILQAPTLSVNRPPVKDQFSALQPDRDRAIVVDFHFHVRSKFAGLRRNIVAPQQFNEALDQRLGSLGQRGVCE